MKCKLNQRFAIKIVDYNLIDILIEKNSIIS